MGNGRDGGAALVSGRRCARPSGRTPFVYHPPRVLVAMALSLAPCLPTSLPVSLRQARLDEAYGPTVSRSICPPHPTPIGRSRQSEQRRDGGLLACLLARAPPRCRRLPDPRPLAPRKQRPALPRCSPQVHAPPRQRPRVLCANRVRVRSRSQWHCVVGSDFKAQFTHESKTFFFVSVGKTNVLLFRTT